MESDDVVVLIIVIIFIIILFIVIIMAFTFSNGNGSKNGDNNISNTSKATLRNKTFFGKSKCKRSKIEMANDTKCQEKPVSDSKPDRMEILSDLSSECSGSDSSYAIDQMLESGSSDDRLSSTGDRSKIIRRKYRTDDTVLDAMTFSDSDVYLLRDTRILRVSSRTGKYQIKINIQLSRIVSFDGTIYGIYNGKLYLLDLSTYENSEWIFKESDTDRTGKIIRIESTHDGNFLWIQTGKEGFLMDSESRIGNKKSMKPYEKRIYGNNEHEYIDISRNSGLAHIKEKKTVLEGIISAVIDHNRSIIILTGEEGKKFSEIRLVSWEPYYITAH